MAKSVINCRPGDRPTKPKGLSRTRTEADPVGSRYLLLCPSREESGSMLGFRLLGNLGRGHGSAALAPLCDTAPARRPRRLWLAVAFVVCWFVCFCWGIGARARWLLGDLLELWASTELRLLASSSALILVQHIGFGASASSSMCCGAAEIGCKQRLRHACQGLLHDREVRSSTDYQCKKLGTLFRLGTGPMPDVSKNLRR